ncbi:2-dehydropantoate 2-reductase [uncultured Acetobacteroides sp.]|uniref:ketopantoate reductase family protein n=1 Tax=uncultured Acetobacteroides sp. TaxID=1760811 RepID=UPI0029F46EF4|nr:2-dehydropantoate 2-reductase [uncultured Acetobacteroides sp.]
MKFAIVGTGGVGGYFGAKLAAAGYDVTFIARGEHLRAIQTNGLRVKSINGDFTVKSAKATSSIAEVGVVDVVFVCLKAWQVRDMAPQLKPMIGDSTVVIPLQNGVMATDELREVLGERAVIRGLCRIFSKVESYGVIHHFGIDPTVIFGENSNEQTDRVLRIKGAFDRAGVTAVIPRDIEVEAWKKFLFICSSGLLAVCRSSYGAVRELPETRQMLVDLFTETYHVAKAKGVNLKPDIIDKTMAMIDTFDYETTSSLTRDVMEGKPSEIEYQNGTVVRLGEKYGVPTPVNRFVYSCILPMEQRARLLQAK